MKPAGAAIVLWGAGCAFLLWRRTAMAPLRVGRALLEDLAALSYQVCVLRRPLPELLEGVLAESRAGAAFWGPLLLGLRAAGESGGSLRRCWRAAADALPPPLGRMAAPLGDLLEEGGPRLAAAIEETREEVAGFLREEAARQAQQGRVTAALCLSAALLLILVCI